MGAKLKAPSPPTPARITQLVRGFSATWKQSVEAMSRDVMRSFTNFKNGTSIIQVSRGPGNPHQRFEALEKIQKEQMMEGPN